MRWNCRCSSACPAARERKEKDCVSTSENGADSRRLNIPTTLGVGYSLIPSMAPARVESRRDRKSTRLNSSHVEISYAVFCLKKKTRQMDYLTTTFNML